MGDDSRMALNPPSCQAQVKGARMSRAGLPNDDTGVDVVVVDPAENEHTNNQWP